MDRRAALFKLANDVAAAPATPTARPLYKNPYAIGGATAGGSLLAYLLYKKLSKPTLMTPTENGDLLT